MGQQTRDCPVCLHTESKTVYRNAMAPIGGMDMSYTVARCARCGFHFARQLADSATIARYYQSASKYDVASTISLIDQTRIDAAVAICAAHAPKDVMVVDLGCGYGALLSCLRQAGFSNLHGVDPAPNAAERAHTLFGLTNIHRGTMDQAHTVVALDQADLVCVMAVLEHLPELHADMQRLLSHLKPGCRILVEVPALDLFQAEGAEPLGELSLEHIQFFGRQSLENLFSGLGTCTVALLDLPLPMLKSGGLFGLFTKLTEPYADVRFVAENPAKFQTYLDYSVRALDAAIARIPRTPFAIYGAGSHTARLIPKLKATHNHRICGIVDGNPNLQGKTLGEWIIQAPQALQQYSGTAVLVSSYRAQNEIAEHLGRNFPGEEVIRMYA
jgi:SAM-dependent methyltransferase